MKFLPEIECVYKDEKYAVRNDGSVFRYPQMGKRPRPTDNQWTFGKPNDKTGYMEIVGVRVHSIVATAFHGASPTKGHVVDHIDTNKRNNRPENLRWVTRLENILLNPITAKRLAYICGSVEAFLENPAKFRDQFQDPNYSWMATVSVEEAQISLQRMLVWANSDKQPSGGRLGDWIFNRPNYQNEYSEPTPELPKIIISLTMNAAQRDWKTASEFPRTPEKYVDDAISAYAENLQTGAIFCRNSWYTSLVFKSAIADSGNSLLILTESAEGEKAIKRFALAEVIYEDGLYIHTSRGTFFSQDGAEKQFCLAQGLQWDGPDSIDDYC